MLRGLAEVWAAAIEYSLSARVSVSEALTILAVSVFRLKSCTVHGSGLFYYYRTQQHSIGA